MGLKIPKILIVTPVYDAKDYCLDAFVKNIEEVIKKTPGSRLLIVDNSKGTSYLSKLRKRYPQHTVMHVDRGPNSRVAICNSMNYARHYAIRYDYDYMLVTESDLFPPADVALKLWSHQKAVVGCYYEIGFFDKPGNPRRPCVFILDYKQDSGLWGSRGITPEEGQKILGKGLVQVHGMGLGCTLIRRDIIERYPFWTNKLFDNKHHDVYFYLDLHNDKIPVYIDTKLFVFHDNSEWADVKDR